MGVKPNKGKQQLNDWKCWAGFDLVTLMFTREASDNEGAEVSKKLAVLMKGNRPGG
jgi:hypothetical protein